MNPKTLTTFFQRKHVRPVTQAPKLHWGDPQWQTHQQGWRASVREICAEDPTAVALFFLQFTFLTLMLAFILMDFKEIRHCDNALLLALLLMVASGVGNLFFLFGLRNYAHELDWAEAATPWELSVTSNGPQFLALAVRAIAYSLPVTIDFHTRQSRIDLPAGSTAETVRDLVAALEPIPRSLLGGDIESVLDLTDQHPKLRGARCLDRLIPLEYTPESRARQELAEFLDENVTVTREELLDLGYLTWATPTQVHQRSTHDEEQRILNERTANIIRQIEHAPGTRI